MGEVFAGRYELIDPLGEGGVGVVWRAWDRRERRYVAAKVLRQVDAASLLRFVREQTFRIDHDHVVMPLGWAGEDDRVLFTMPLVGGGSVATLIGDFGLLPPQWVAVLLDQLLDALAAIHAVGLVHRDVKPANLLLEPTGTGRPHLRLGDFGIAAHVRDPRLTHTDVILGTPGYLAPELLQGADLDPRQDLFAAGMTAVEMLTGEPPGTSADAAPALATVSAPEPLAAIVRRLASSDPSDRPASAIEARRQLAATGLLPPPGAAPETDGADVEIFDQLPPLPAEAGRGAWSDPGSGMTMPAVHSAAAPADHLSPAVGTRDGGPGADGAPGAAAGLGSAASLADRPGPRSLRLLLVSIGLTVAGIVLIVAAIALAL